MVTTVLIERGKDGRFGIFTPDINSTIIGEGATVAEAKSDFENSVREILQFYKEDGKPIPDELKDIEFEYRYDIASMFDYYDWINVTRFARRAGINASLMRQYKTGKAYISGAQIDRIESTLHSLGKEMAAIKL